MSLLYLELGNKFHVSCPDYMLTKLQRLQNRGLKLTMPRTSRFTNVDIHVEASMFPCKYRRLLALQLMFSQVSSSINILYNTRRYDGPFLIAPKPNSVKFKRIVFFLGPTKCNYLPPHIKNVKDNGQFKNTLLRITTLTCFEIIGLC